jgi:hypothetical protein
VRSLQQLAQALTGCCILLRYSQLIWDGAKLALGICGRGICICKGAHCGTNGPACTPAVWDALSVTGLILLTCGSEYMMAGRSGTRHTCGECSCMCGLCALSHAKTTATFSARTVAMSIRVLGRATRCHRLARLSGQGVGVVVPNSQLATVATGMARASHPSSRFQQIRDGKQLDRATHTNHDKVTANIRVSCVFIPVLFVPMIARSLHVRDCLLCARAVTAVCVRKRTGKATHDFMHKLTPGIILYLILVHAQGLKAVAPCSADLSKPGPFLTPYTGSSTLSQPYTQVISSFHDFGRGARGFSRHRWRLFTCLLQRAEVQPVPGVTTLCDPIGGISRGLSIDCS